MMKNKNLLLIDNYDSFTHNLYQYFKKLNIKVDIVKNDQGTDIQFLKYDGIVFSPGPGLPAEAGMMPAVIKNYVSKLPMLGVCLGFQAISEHFGAALTQMEQVYHGISSRLVEVDFEDALYQNIPTKINVGRYHSWGVKLDSLPKILRSTALSKDKYVMSFSHKTFPVYGIQYHPESILSNHGMQILQNFCNTL